MGGWVGSRTGQGVLKVKLKGRVHPLTGHESPKGLDGGVSLKPHPSCFTPPPMKEIWYPLWAPQPFWTGVENLACMRIRSLDCPVDSQLLY